MVIVIVLRAGDDVVLGELVVLGTLGGGAIVVRVWLERHARPLGDVRIGLPVETELVPDAAVRIRGMRPRPHDQRVVGLQRDHRVGEEVVLLDVGEAFVGHRAVVVAEARSRLPTQALHVGADVA